MINKGYYAFFPVLVCSLVMAGCTNNTVSTTEQVAKIEHPSKVNSVDSCKKYFDIQKCIISKQPDATVRKQMEDSNTQGMTSWEIMDKEVLKTTCESALKSMESSKEVFAQMGCAL